MADRYQQLINTPIGKIVSKQVGLPTPVTLERYEPGQPVVSGPVLLGAAPGGRLADSIQRFLGDAGAEVITGPPASDQTFKAIVFDASGIGSSEDLREAWSFFHPVDPPGTGIGADHRPGLAARRLRRLAGSDGTAGA